MRAIGSDRVRMSGDTVILLCAFSKGWTPRTPASGTHAEFPGTTVLWDEQYFEVVEAAGADGGRIRYVLVPWREDHTIRTFEHYSDEAEARRIADYELAKKQRRASAASRWSGLVLGHLPEPAQRRMQNELGIAPTRITVISCIPPMAVFGIFVFISVGAFMRGQKSLVPGWLFALAFFMFFESLLRFIVAMQVGRGVGSVIGTLAYGIYSLVTPKRAGAPPPERRGDGLFTLPPTAEVALRDSLAVKAPLLTLLSRAEQTRLAERHGFDYRAHAYGPAWVMLVCGLLGAVSSYVKLTHGAGTSVLISMLLALA
ncbi:MAG TPA: hypothetical protein VF911_18620, partial [Thermoanaerobaculia bacterium]